MAETEEITAIRSRLDSERRRLLETFENLPLDIIERPFQGGWSIKDILAHVTVGESVNVAFAQRMLVKESPRQVEEFANTYPDFPVPFDLDRFNAWMTERLGPQSWNEVRSALDRARAETLAWLGTLSPVQLERKGEHAVWGIQTVRSMLRILAIHDRFHRADIEKRK